MIAALSDYGIAEMRRRCGLPPDGVPRATAPVKGPNAQKILERLHAAGTTRRDPLSPAQRITSTLLRYDCCCEPEPEARASRKATVWLPQLFGGTTQ